MNITNQVFVDRLEGTTVDRVPTVGDVMLLRSRYDHEPAITGNVSRTTKTQFRVTGSDGKEYGPFKMESWNQYEDRLADGSPASYESTEPATRFYFCRFDYRTKAYGKYDACYFASDFAKAWLEKIRVKAERRAAEKKAVEAKRQQEYAERVAAELAEVKEACGFACATSPINPKVIKNVMPDGSRIYTIDMPVKPCYAERKAGWERLIIRCKAAEYWDFRADVQKKGVESAYTYINGSSCSFASCSSGRFETDEDAVWDALRQQYHSW